MPLPYFYLPQLNGQELTLDEDTSKHVVQVLRMEKGEQLILIDGKGKKVTTTIVDDHRKRCTVRVDSEENAQALSPNIAVAISLLKNSARFEWFLEKATEIGVNEIIPLICTRTEKEKFRTERLRQILVSAMLQSQQSFMPVLSEPVAFTDVVSLPYDQKFIAHCVEDKKETIPSLSQSSIILIGPEGDFTPEEIRLALNQQFLPVTLGATRLRTETAGMVAATLMRIGR